jgi:hypothetical protein
VPKQSTEQQELKTKAGIGGVLVLGVTTEYRL